MGGCNLLGELVPPTTNHAEEKERLHYRDSGNCSEVEEGQNTNRAIELEFQLTQSLLSQVKAGENNRYANSGKQARLDLERISFVINGKEITSDNVQSLYCKLDQLISGENANYRLFAKQVFTEIFEYAKAEIPNDNILEELITNCNQAGYDGSLFTQLYHIFSNHQLTLLSPKDRKISIVCNSQGSLDIQYCTSIAVRELDTNKKICRVDAILEFTLEFRDSKVEYENGKVKFAIPEQLKNYKDDGKSLSGEISRYFKDEDNRIIETLEKNMNEGPRSFAAEDLSITESSSDSSEVANKVVTHPGILGNVANLLLSVAEVVSVVVPELLWPKYQVNIEPRHNEEEFAIIPENLTFDELMDIINKAKNYGDYTGLDKNINNKEESVRFITHLNCGNLKDFFSQHLNLTDHMHNVLLSHRHDETNGYYNYSVKELSLLAIAADDTLVQRYVKDYVKEHKTILFKQDEDLDRLLIGVGGQRYTQLLLEYLEKERVSYMPWYTICQKLQRALYIGNQECVKAVLDKFKDTEPICMIDGLKHKFLHYAIQLDFIDVAKAIIDHKIIADINIIDHYGSAPLHHASLRNNLELVGLLIRNGAEIDIQDLSRGRTSLHLAACGDKFEIVKLLANKGADWKIKDKDGKTALDLVLEKSLRPSSKGNREKSSNELEITKFLRGLDDKTPLHLNIKKDPESKNIDNQQPQRNIVDKVENIMNNEEASIEEAIGNNCEEGKMPGNEKIIGEGHETRISVIDTVEAEATANGTVSSNSVPCTLGVELTSDDEDLNNDINVNQPTEHVEQVANGNRQPKTELPRINEQSSKSGLKKNPQNTKKYVVAASALAIAGIVSGVAVAVYLEMLAVGIAVAACCLIAATVTYCCRPKSLIENGEPAEIVFKERSVY
ncbi:ankyrin repeat domain-containing protein [Wolbachia endosymbiont of Frankliniella intonsa]|uniref:ankyrin repeat domain-containing protein n=1 Tax=Wolbachia endosymbiont of Frankliniella intonsa TaxID=2902422 RepID=UPI00244E7B50|nr:ankyrin repeat domain-containing protein [Wolbachia endosymbiont of Frankliniella intonsa]WGJ62112.1 ankyrin repeat domain-containing protein [Wolbachia endosymbiont of Frankliniella intonsa]